MAAAVATTLAVALLAAAPAHAGRLTVHDPVDDMWVVAEGSTEPAPAPGTAIGDFIRTSFRHSGARVVVKAKFVELQPAGKRTRLWVLMRDQDRRKTWALVETTRKDRHGSARLMTNRGGDIECKVRYSVDFAKNTMTVSVPRRCLDNPRYLSFKASSEHVKRGRTYAFVDSSHSKWASSRGWSDPVRGG